MCFEIRHSDLLPSNSNYHRCLVYNIDLYFSSVVMKQTSKVAKLGLLILGIIFILALTSCKSSHNTTEYSAVDKAKKAINRARRALDKKVQANQSQYAFYNNQIIIFENN